MKQTVLHQKHVQSKAKMTEFQGWQVPQFYTDAAEEYNTVRTAAGLFDVGFLGRIEISGPAAPSLLNQVFTRNTAAIAERTAHYGFLCNDAGGILDDALLIRLPAGPAGPRFLLTTNASNTDKVLSWIEGRKKDGVEITDRSNTTAHFAVQGPMSTKVLDSVPGCTGSKKFKPRTVKQATLFEASVIVSRTGYTGELGYEFIVPREAAERIWDGLMAAGRPLGLMPCGLTCRDTLRIEAGYLLYGTDIDENRSPIEAAGENFVDWDKDFIGKDALLRLKTGGTDWQLAGFVLTDKSVPRTGSSIFSENHEIGTVTSACLSPFMRTGIGLGYVVKRYAQPGQEIEIELREREVTAKIIELPFFRKKT
jgi:aminomethyltransferase